MFKVWPYCPTWVFYHFASPRDMFEDACLPAALPSECVITLEFFQRDEIDYFRVLLICISLIMSEVEYLFLLLGHLYCFAHALCQQFLGLGSATPQTDSPPAWLSIAEIHHSLLIHFTLNNFPIFRCLV